MQTFISMAIICETLTKRIVTVAKQLTLNLKRVVNDEMDTHRDVDLT